MKDLVFERLQIALTGRFTVDRALGHGGMANVYLAADLRHERLVALKVLRAPLASAVTVERFLREIKYLAQLTHPNILPLYDSGDALGMPYYVTQYIEGETLRLRIDRSPGRRLPVDETVRIAGGLAEALDHAHRRNILHRDIKPENVLFKEGRPVIVDFGIARAIVLAGERELTDSGKIIGTPQYMSPEQLRGERELDARSDLYGLACVVNEMLTGESPFMGPRGVVDNERKFTERPRSLRQLRPEIPEAIDEAVTKALATYPHQRFDSAGQFAAAMR